MFFPACLSFFQKYRMSKFVPETSSSKFSLKIIYLIKDFIPKNSIASPCPWLKLNYVILYFCNMQKASLRGEASRKYCPTSALHRELLILSLIYIYIFILPFLLKCTNTNVRLFLLAFRGAQLNEALQLQMEVQRRLSDQLEV